MTVVVEASQALLLREDGVEGGEGEPEVTMTVVVAGVVSSDAMAAVP